MAAIRTMLVTYNHAYTSEDAPWLMDTVNDPAGSARALNGRSGWRLFHYLAGGKTFGLPWRFHIVLRRQRRFLRVAVVLLAVWCLFWFL